MPEGKPEIFWFSFMFSSSSSASLHSATATSIKILLSSATGFELTAPLAFTLFSIYSALQFTVGTLPYSLKCITEAKVSLDR